MANPKANRTMASSEWSANGRHMALAWTSLLWVAFTDIYVRLCAMGVWTNVRFF